MTAPSTALSELLATRDSSLALGAAALARVAGADGRTTFDDLAIAYRDAFLRLRGELTGLTGPDAGTLSVDEARDHLRTSVLPRLALLDVAVVPTGQLWGEAPVAFTASVWPTLGPTARPR